MSELDTYFQPTGRRAGEAGSLQPGTMSLMDRRQAVSNMQNDQRRRMELARRVQRQLGQQSRRGNVRAGLLALDFMDREAAAGQPIPAGVSSFESNRARGAQTIMDNEDQISLMDAVTNGGSMSQTGTEPGYQPGTNADANRRWAAGVVAEQGRAEQQMAGGAGSLAQRVASATAGTPTALPAPASTPVMSGQMDRSGSRFRAGATGNGQGGMLTDSDRELLDAGRRVSGLVPQGFGSRPSGQFGLVSSVASAAPVAAPTPSPMPSAPAAPAAPVAFDPATLPRETQLKVEGMRGRQKMDSEILAKRESQYNSDMAALQREKETPWDVADRNLRRAEEDVAMSQERQAIEARTLADRAEQARKVEANKKSRMTKRSDVKDAEGSIFAGNAYRPVNWTQQDEDDSAAEMRLGNSLARFSMFGMGLPALRSLNRATGRAVDPSKWNR